MYNPFQLSECEKEKKKYRRKSIDMSMTILGIVASLSSVPQVIKIAGNGNIEGVSLATQVIAPFSLVAWFSYGLYIKNYPLVITSTITILILSVVVTQILILG